MSDDPRAGEKPMSGFIPPNPAYEKAVRESFSRMTLMTTLGARLAKVAPGEVDVELVVRDEFTQQHGFVAAGVVTAIVDTACGFAAQSLMPEGSGVVTVEYKVNFVAPASGERLLAQARVLKPGRVITVCAGDVYALGADSGQAVATMLTTMIALRDTPEVARPATGTSASTDRPGARGTRVS
jgi:uncharacterized protein (TIGR00369 family)